MKKESKSDAPIENNGVLGDFPLTGCILDVDIQNAYLAVVRHQNFLKGKIYLKKCPCFLRCLDNQLVS